MTKGKRMNGSESQEYSILQRGVENLEVLLPVYQDFLRYYYGRYGYRLRDIPLTSRGIREYLLEQFKQAGAVVFLTVDQAAPGNAAGFTLLCEGPSNQNELETWQIKDLYVSPAKRGLGLGTRLVEAACLFCEREGASSVSLLTGRINREARALYEKCGFVLDPGYNDPQNVRYRLRIGSQPRSPAG
jgi:ribosomal protein S18 acetylase RimI-like enzyme